MLTKRPCMFEDDNRKFGSSYRLYRQWRRSAGLLLLLAAAPGFAQTSDLVTDRAGHAATLLPSGLVLVTGGVDATGKAQASAELYNPATHTSAKTGGMMNAREHHTSTLLGDGTVLITGGDQEGNALSTAEIYDPKTQKFALTAQMHRTHTDHTATLLNNGNVLIVGGAVAEIYNIGTTPKFTETLGAPVVPRKNQAAVLLTDPSGDVLITGGYNGNQAQDTAELYSPGPQTFVQLKSVMTIPRALHSATRLSNGTVVITGGFSGTSPHAQVDFYDPATKTFSAGGNMLFPRASHRQVLLSNGEILIIGGTTFEGGILSTNELYNPSNQQSITQGSLTINRAGHTATLLPDGNTYVAGGITGGLTQNSAEIINPATSGFSLTNPMNFPRALHTDTLLPNGMVLLTGGGNEAVFESTAEIFNPSNNTFTQVGSMLAARESHTATLLQSGTDVLIAGGKSDSGDLAEAELYNVASMTFSATGSMNEGRSLDPAVLLTNGDVLVIGGRHGGRELNTAELYNPTSRTFTFTTGTLNKKRKRMPATLLTTGSVLVPGGEVLNNGTGGSTGRSTVTAEVFDHANQLFTVVGHMHQDREDNASIMLTNGTVLVTGGNKDNGPQDLYDPGTARFLALGHLLNTRSRHRMVLLNSNWGSLKGDVLIIGGSSQGSGIFGGLFQALDSVEIYHSRTQKFERFGTMVAARWGHSATQLTDGRILIAGGTGAVTVSGTAEEVGP